MTVMGGEKDSLEIEMFLFRPLLIKLEGNDIIKIQDINLKMSELSGVKNVIRKNTINNSFLIILLPAAVNHQVCNNILKIPQPYPNCKMVTRDAFVLKYRTNQIRAHEDLELRSPEMTLYHVGKHDVVELVMSNSTILNEFDKRSLNELRKYDDRIDHVTGYAVNIRDEPGTELKILDFYYNTIAKMLTSIVQSTRGTIITTQIGESCKFFYICTEPPQHTTINDNIVIVSHQHKLSIYGIINFGEKILLLSTVDTHIQAIKHIYYLSRPQHIILIFTESNMYTIVYEPEAGRVHDNTLVIPLPLQITSVTDVRYIDDLLRCVFSDQHDDVIIVDMLIANFALHGMYNMGKNKTTDTVFSKIDMKFTMEYQPS